MFECTGSDETLRPSTEEDAFSCRSLSAKEPLTTGLFCRKWPTKIRQPMGRRTALKRWKGCLKLRVSFRQRATNYRALLAENGLRRSGILWVSVLGRSADLVEVSLFKLRTSSIPIQSNSKNWLEVLTCSQRLVQTVIRLQRSRFVEVLTLRKYHGQTWSQNTNMLDAYGVATIRRLLHIVGLFCKRALLTRVYSAKGTYNLK